MGFHRKKSHPKPSSRHFNGKEVTKLFKQFNRISSRNGTLDFAGFRQSLGLLGMVQDSLLCQRLFSVFNASGTGSITFEEYANGLGILVKGSIDEKLEFAFAMADIDDSGKVTYDELLLTVQSIMNIYTSIMGESDNSMKLDSDRVKRMFNRLDRNKDGFISVEEYKCGMKKHPEFIASLRGSDVFESSKGKQMVSLKHKVEEYEKLIDTLQEGLDSALSILRHQSSSESKKSMNKLNDTLEQDISDGELTETEEFMSSEESDGDEIPHVTIASSGKVTVRFKDDASNSNEVKDIEVSDAIDPQHSKMVNQNKLESNATKNTTTIDTLYNLDTKKQEFITKKQLNLKDINQKLNGVAASKFATVKSAPTYRPINLTSISEDFYNLDDHSKVIPVDGLSKNVSSLDFTKNGLHVEVDGCDDGNVFALLQNMNLKLHHTKASLTKTHVQQNNTTSTRIKHVNRVHSEDSSHRTSDHSSIHEQHIFDTIVQTPVHVDEHEAISKVIRPSSKGSTVFFGHKNWDLVINVMKGIQIATGRSNAETSRPIGAFDFSVKEKYTLVAGATFREGAAKTETPVQDIEDDIHGRSCRFVDYAPLVFRRLRSFFGITNKQYVHSIGPGNMLSNLMLGTLSTLSELGSEGKSGSFFYFTSDGKFMVKTVRRDEHKLLRNMLPQYYNHMTKKSSASQQVPESLLCRIVGCHMLRLSKHSRLGARKIYLIVMTNMMQTNDLEINRRFDLKGSWVGRKVSAAEQSDPKTTLKDMDFIQLKQKIKIGKTRKEKLMASLKRDTDFLERQNLIDYSLLLGITYHDTNGSLDDSGSSAISTQYQSLQSTTTESDTGKNQPPFYKQDRGGMRSEDGSETYTMGVLDFLTGYSSFKRAERFGKILLCMSPNGISVAPPQLYAKRFIEFLEKHVE